MKVINLYRYTREGGGTTVSTVEPNTEYTILYRLIADEGMVLTNGTDITSCVDTDTPDDWIEVEAPEEEDPRD